MEELGIPGLGGESGNAEALATTVLEQCGGGKVLFLRGDQAKDTVVEVLTGGGVEVDQVLVMVMVVARCCFYRMTSLVRGWCWCWCRCR